MFISPAKIAHRRLKYMQKNTVVGPICGELCRGSTLHFPEPFYMGIIRSKISALGLRPKDFQLCVFGLHSARLKDRPAGC